MSAPTLEPVLVTCVQAGRMLGGLASWPVMRLCDAGELRSGYIGRRRMIDADSVREYAKRVVDGTAPNILVDEDASA